MTGKIILMLLVFGMLCGLLFAATDLANPMTNGAEARRDNIETDYLAQKNGIDLEQYRILKEAETQAELKRLDDEAQHRQQLYAQELQFSRVWSGLKLELLRFSGYVLCLSLLAISIGVGVRIARQPNLARARAEIEKRAAIAKARGREEERRLLLTQLGEIRAGQIKTPAPSNGRQGAKRPSLPVAQPVKAD